MAYIIRPDYKNIALTYLDRCKRLSTYVNIKAINSTDYIMNYPCSNSIDSSSIAIRKTNMGEAFVSTEIVKNSIGEYWYKITANEDGARGYIYGGSAEYVDIAENVVSGNAKLTTITPKKGSPVTISGKIESKAKIISITGTLKGGDNKQTAKVSVNDNTFNIKGSKIDNNLKFGNLGKGSGYLQLNIVVSAPSIQYNKLIENQKTFTLSKITFKVK